MFQRMSVPGPRRRREHDRVRLPALRRADRDLRAWRRRALRGRSTASSTLAACRSISPSARVATSACRQSPSASRVPAARALTLVAQTVAARMSVRAATADARPLVYHLLRRPRPTPCVVRRAGSRQGTTHGTARSAANALERSDASAGGAMTRRDGPDQGAGHAKPASAASGDRRDRHRPLRRPRRLRPHARRARPRGGPGARDGGPGHDGRGRSSASRGRARSSSAMRSSRSSAGRGHTTTTRSVPRWPPWPSAPGCTDLGDGR